MEQPCKHRFRRVSTIHISRTPRSSETTAWTTPCLRHDYQTIHHELSMRVIWHMLADNPGREVPNRTQLRRVEHDARLSDALA